MTECTFCRILRLGDGIIYEDEHFFAQFDKFPVSPGHAEVIPKRHVTSFNELTGEEWGKLKDAIIKVQEIIERTDLKEVYKGFLKDPLDETSEKFCRDAMENPWIVKKPDGYNIGINEGEAAGRTVDHLHWHIIPRFFGDVKDFVGGIRHIMPDKGNYKA